MKSIKANELSLQWVRSFNSISSILVTDSTFQNFLSKLKFILISIKHEVVMHSSFLFEDLEVFVNSSSYEGMGISKNLPLLSHSLIL